MTGTFQVLKKNKAQVGSKELRLLIVLGVFYFSNAALLIC
jgi:hypothetical protein